MKSLTLIFSLKGGMAKIVRVNQKNKQNKNLLVIGDDRKSYIKKGLTGFSGQPFFIRHLLSEWQHEP
jgi:hypothetical protein